MAKHDIVYILKEDVAADELRYSLRSVCRNFKYNKIWFYGGCPKELKPDNFVRFIQKGESKWDKSMSTLRSICNNDGITPKFYLFNDDFFILKPYDQDAAISNGTLDMQVRRIIEKTGGNSAYTRRLRTTEQVLRGKGYDTISYAVHTPMLIDRAKAIEALDALGTAVMFRSAYGNYCEVGGILMPDVKITSVDEMPSKDVALLSTSDKSFIHGKVGAYIRDRFNTRCKYEVDDGI